MSSVFQLIDWNVADWNLPVLNSLLLPFEVENIVNIPLVNLQGRDSLVWTDNANGFFSVKSAYKLIKKWESLDRPGASDAIVDLEKILASTSFATAEALHVASLAQWASDEKAVME